MPLRGSWVRIVAQGQVRRRGDRAQRVAQAGVREMQRDRPLQNIPLGYLAPLLAGAESATDTTVDACPEAARGIPAAQSATIAATLMLTVIRCCSPW